MSDTTDWKARAELLEGRLREERGKLEKQVNELSLDLCHWRDRAQVAEDRIERFVASFGRLADARREFEYRQDMLISAAESRRDQDEKKRQS